MVQAETACRTLSAVLPLLPLQIEERDFQAARGRLVAASQRGMSSPVQRLPPQVRPLLQAQLERAYHQLRLAHPKPFLFPALDADRCKSSRRSVATAAHPGTPRPVSRRAHFARPPPAQQARATGGGAQPRAAHGGRRPARPHGLFGPRSAAPPGALARHRRRHRERLRALGARHSGDLHPRERRRRRRQGPQGRRATGAVETI